ncbi:energy-coupling factor transporter transmembrane component T family protein [Thermostichus vulcanus]|uniref:Energy-coupling factor transporter transmembrane protein EcfT n=1 Tax=Thermostichus vulcanus str. 'Rupite' TaxID=2813851 RepID=A0ABT0CFM3_THEVL|nr:energy-coupling factor transporter transmembrane component T [Thermostichus vulcanus]MCJ2544569.1 energy-coupling factor transporter transmembrane protein EcfT [Thermostichus vulcanus str. 'Rupite']
MLVSWKYRPRSTVIQRLDPRARLIYLACVIASLTLLGIWDLRLILPLFLFNLSLYSMARIEWQDIGRAWLFILVLLVGIVGLNVLVGGRGGPASVLEDTSDPIVSIPLGWYTLQITAVRLFFAVTQLFRMLSMAILALMMPYTFDPNLYGVAFRCLGASDKVAFTMDLALRFLPSFARDLSTVVDAQRARGYEVDNLKGGIPARLLRLAPLLVPVTMRSILTGEEVIDAMELRAFGVAPRTWLTQLRFTTQDDVLMGIGLGLIGLFGILRFGFGLGGFWMPEGLR